MCLSCDAVLSSWCVLCRDCALPAYKPKVCSQAAVLLLQVSCFANYYWHHSDRSLTWRNQSVHVHWSQKSSKCCCFFSHLTDNTKVVFIFTDWKTGAYIYPCTVHRNCWYDWLQKSVLQHFKDPVKSVCIIYYYSFGPDASVYMFISTCSEQALWRERSLQLLQKGPVIHKVYLNLKKKVRCHLGGHPLLRVLCLDYVIDAFNN